ncbi:hypothetical protein Ancab_022312 [Ancistrocladus abbreviatus]
MGQGAISKFAKPADSTFRSVRLKLTRVVEKEDPRVTFLRHPVAPWTTERNPFAPRKPIINAAVEASGIVPRKMSPQRQARRPTEEGQEHIKYGDVFSVSGELAEKPIAPEDAASLQSAEKKAFGDSTKGGAAEVMKWASRVNVQAGLVTPDDVATNEGVEVVESEEADTRTVTDVVGDLIVTEYVEPKELEETTKASTPSPVSITVGEALVATALMAGDRPITVSDAAAIREAEMTIMAADESPPPVGLGSEAQLAAAWNVWTTRQERKTTLGDVLGDAAARLTGYDRPATLEDGERVLEAELINSPKLTTTQGGVAESVATAARFNQDEFNCDITNEFQTGEIGCQRGRGRDEV